MILYTKKTVLETLRKEKREDWAEVIHNICDRSDLVEAVLADDTTGEYAFALLCCPAMKSAKLIKTAFDRFASHNRSEERWEELAQHGVDYAKTKATIHLRALTTV